jgi:xanthosine phosphorylase
MTRAATSTRPEDAAAAVRDRAGAAAAPRVGIVLGSGLGPFADGLEDRVAIPYGELPGFRAGTVGGHAGAFVLGRHGGVPVACLSGRSHVYEGITGDAVTTPVRTLRVLGAEIILVTAAVGSLRPETGAGALVAITDHVNLQGFSPLTGPEDERFGPRFPDLRGAYDPDLRTGLHAAARAAGVPLHEGVYLAVAGPAFETPAEIRAFRTLGADVVGMSLVPEVIAARHCGLRVAALAVVTNLAAGMDDGRLDHEQTLAAATAAGDDLRAVVGGWLEGLA